MKQRRRDHRFTGYLWVSVDKCAVFFLRVTDFAGISGFPVLECPTLAISRLLQFLDGVNISREHFASSFVLLEDAIGVTNVKQSARPWGITGSCRPRPIFATCTISFCSPEFTGCSAFRLFPALACPTSPGVISRLSHSMDLVFRRRKKLTFFFHFSKKCTSSSQVFLDAERGHEYQTILPSRKSTGSLQVSPNACAVFGSYFIFASSCKRFLVMETILARIYLWTKPRLHPCTEYFSPRSLSHQFLGDS